MTTIITWTILIGAGVFFLGGMILAILKGNTDEEDKL